MHSWLTCLDNDDQTIGHPTRKHKSGDKKNVRKQGSSSKSYKGNDCKTYVPKGQNTAKFMKGLMSAYNASLKTSEEASSGSDSSYSACKISLHIADIIDSGASSTFVTSKNDLTNPLPHNTTLSTATGQKHPQTKENTW